MKIDSLDQRKLFHPLLCQRVLCICFLIFVLAGCTSANVQLREAIQRDDAQAVKSAVASGADKNSCANDGWSQPYQGLTPLNIAISDSRSRAALALIEVGADVNRRDYRSVAPLGYAVGQGNVEVMKALLSAGADPNAPYMTKSGLSDGESLMATAVQNRKAAVVEVLLQHGAKADQPDKYGRTAFWFTGGKLSDAEAALLNPQIRQIRQRLLEAGVNPDPRDYKGRTYSVVQKLNIDYDDEAERERDLSFTDQSGTTDTRQSALTKSKPGVDKLKRAASATNQATQARLYQAIKKADVKAMKHALMSGAIINAPFGKAATESRHEHATPLIVAIELGHVSMVNALLKAGADPMVSASNWPPLHHAARSGKPAILRALLDKGADANYGTYQFGETALMHAIISGSVESVKLLLDRGANPDARTSEGNSMDYFLFTNEEAIKKLLQQARARKVKTAG